MGLLSYFRNTRQQQSAAIAKERLQILVAHERKHRGRRPSYLPRLQKELLEVIQKYVNVDKEAISVNLEQNDHHEILELNVVLPDERMRQRA